MDLAQPLNDPSASPAARLAALRALAAGRSASPSPTGDVNNHIHTIYSFSPYTPAMAAFRAREAGLEVAGSVDHDSIGAAAEMLDACALLGLGAVAGFEVRVSFRDGPFGDRKLNNPDSVGIAYMTVQGIARDAIPTVDKFLEPVRARRRERTRRMAEALGGLLVAGGLRPLEFDRDVLARSKASEGGGLTERHLLAGVAGVLVEAFGQGSALVAGLERSLGVKAPPKIAALLSDPANPHYLFDVLGLLKSTLLDRVFLQPDQRECLPAATVLDFARGIGAIPAYAYLGDVGESPTGDKKAEKFEDDFIEPLFEELRRMGYLAVAYMPPRNTVAQLRRVQALCARHGLMEISGVDINSSRQAFNCPEVLRPEFRHLVDTTWALVAHQALVSRDRRWGLFAPENPLAGLPLTQRLAAYARTGRVLDPRDPVGTATVPADAPSPRD